MAVVSINLDKANLSMESHKTLGFTILDSSGQIKLTLACAKNTTKLTDFRGCC